MDFKYYLWKSGLSDFEFCKLFELTPRTISNYKKANKAPKAIELSLMLLSGEIPIKRKNNGFENWYFHNGLLHSPEGEKFSSGDLRAIHFDKKIIKSLEAEILRLKKEKEVFKVVSKNVIKFPSKRVRADMIA
jgi:hypothetical protein